MANSNPVEAVNHVSPVKGAKDLYALHQDAVKQEENWEKLLHTKDVVRTVSCFLMIIEIINHIGLDKVDSGVIAQSQLMDIEHQMQECMTDITKFINEIQSKVKGYNLFSTSDGTHKLAPDSYLGLDYNYYNIDETGKEMISSSPDGTSSNDFNESLHKFEAAFKKLFFANGDSDTSSPKLKDLSYIQNPNVLQKGKDFDLTKYWNDLKGAYDQVNLNKGNIVTNNAEDRPSLIQRWMYYKALTTVNSSSTETVNGAKGDIGSLVSFAPNGTKASSFLNQFYSFYGLMDTTVSTGTVTAPFSWTNWVSGSKLDTATQESFIDLMIHGKENLYLNNGTLEPGLFAAFNFEAYNSFWSKVNAYQNVSTDLPPNPGTSLTNGDGQRASSADSLPTFLSSANLVQTSIGTETGSGSTDMQQMTANEGDFVDVGQGIIKSLNQYASTLSVNQLSA